MCGIAGAGKTTYAKALEASGWVRLSIDEEVWERLRTTMRAPMTVGEATTRHLELYRDDSFALA